MESKISVIRIPAIEKWEYLDLRRWNHGFSSAHGIPIASAFGGGRI
jgi:hypothetical protein